MITKSVSAPLPAVKNVNEFANPFTGRTNANTVDNNYFDEGVHEVLLKVSYSPGIAFEDTY